jgi:hypothetical protein
LVIGQLALVSWHWSLGFYWGKLDWAVGIVIEPLLVIGAVVIWPLLAQPELVIRHLIGLLDPAQKNKTPNNYLPLTIDN